MKFNTTETARWCISGSATLKDRTSL